MGTTTRAVFARRLGVCGPLFGARLRAVGEAAVISCGLHGLLIAFQLCWGRSSFWGRSGMAVDDTRMDA